MKNRRRKYKIHVSNCTPGWRVCGLWCRRVTPSKRTLPLFLFSISFCSQLLSTQTSDFCLTENPQMYEEWAESSTKTRSRVTHTVLPVISPSSLLLFKYTAVIYAHCGKYGFFFLYFKFITKELTDKFVKRFKETLEPCQVQCSKNHHDYSWLIHSYMVINEIKIVNHSEALNLNFLSADLQIDQTFQVKNSSYWETTGTCCSFTLLSFHQDRLVFIDIKINPIDPPQRDMSRETERLLLHHQWGWGSIRDLIKYHINCGTFIRKPQLTQSNSKPRVWSDRLMKRRATAVIYYIYTLYCFSTHAVRQVDFYISSFGLWGSFESIMWTTDHI